MAAPINKAPSTYTHSTENQNQKTGNNELNKVVSETPPESKASTVNQTEHECQLEKVSPTKVITLNMKDYDSVQKAIDACCVKNQGLVHLIDFSEKTPKIVKSKNKEKADVAALLYGPSIPHRAHQARPQLVVKKPDPKKTMLIKSSSEQFSDLNINLQSAHIQQRQQLLYPYVTSGNAGFGKTATVFLSNFPVGNEYKSCASKRVPVARELLLKEELAVLSAIDSPYVIKAYGTYDWGSHVDLIMEHGGSDIQKIFATKQFNMQQPIFTEDETKHYFSQLLKGVLAVHRAGYAHLDIKLENCLINEKNGKLKLCDFGEAADLRSASSVQSSMGTEAYVAPESLRSIPVCDKRSDAWSLGITLYAMLKGRVPFEMDMWIAHELLSGDLPAMDENGISFLAMDLIKKLLVTDPANRMTVQDALSHPFLQSSFQNDNHS
ncbi:MAG: serine/threonine-protein kinase [Desulfobacteraceae bacterium]|nr:serine/threonine-protein kinase [Desulfobacteraceae bacterium]